MKIRPGILPVMLVSLGLSGCIFGGKKAAKVTAPAPAPTAGPPPSSTPVAKPAGNPEAVGTLTAPLINPPAIEEPTLKAPELPPTDRPPSTPPRRPARPRQPAQPITPPTTAEQQQVPAPVPVPQLGEILTDARRHQIETEMADHLARARDVLTRASRAALNSGQVETRERIRIFIQQAESARDRDPATALQLATRADVLAQDLLPALH